ncbi:T9SS type B sorting domain-containing protein [Oceanihabitans sp. 1_MG-2023]|uniref:T9SS type B sorting domain-containing protein n=1 Tax=Flavobacteriaceae TaxID=49546 RepID=UPI002090D6CC|nr:MULTISPECIES: T9SS type B sorting domain-containing protein [Flavobacteriaceae]MDO6621442.1 T9SS type B sorting domain-containing protein [Oceanihabitans sp. 1_MG-2023]
MKKFLIFGFLVLLVAQVHAQEPNDCVNAITVCGNGNFSSNASGIGNTQEVSGCGGSEHNSLWLEVNIVQAGTLGFNLIPDDPDILVDYDFWVYGPDRLCSNLGSPIRCATTNPDAAGLSNNHTGINGSTTLTQTGPGASGNGYVYWLSVLPGQTYYLVIDRPHGDGGFEIEWTGTAMAGTGAFPTPPAANSIDDVIACSGTPDVSIFNLNGLSSSISNDLANETVQYYENLADATDGVSPLPGIYVNSSNPQLIYAKVLSSVTDCYSLVEFNLVVSEIPDATVSVSDTDICEGENVTFNFSGTPNAVVNYNINSGTTQQIVLDNAGVATLTQTLTVNTTITLENGQVVDGSGTIICSQILVDSTTVTVNPNLTPTFTQVAAICSGDALAALPTTSNNSVTGTWSPAIDNTTTTTYTFTPDAGQCATSETMTITVNPNLTPTFTQVPAICSGDALAALPTTSNNGITGTWSPAIDNTATTTYTFTPDAGQCAVTETMTVTVSSNITPIFTQVAAICSGETLAALPITSNNGVTGTWSPAIDNTATTIYTFTPDVGQCAVSETMTITVNPTVTPVFTQVAPICSGETLTALPTTSNNGVTGTWSPAIDNTTTTTYTFTPDAGQCGVTETMTITVNPSVLPTFTQVAPICSGETLTALPTTSNNGITGTWSPALDNTATTTYTFTSDAGQCAANTSMTITVNPTVTPVFTQVAPICSGETLAVLPTTSNNGVTGTWSPAIDNTATTTYTFTPDVGQCAVSETMTITVNPTVTPVFTQVAPICSGETLAALPTTSNNGVTGTWSPAIDNTTTTTYTFTPDVGQCGVTETMTITVNPSVLPTFTQVAAICEGDTLAALPTTSNNGITGTWSPALDNTATTTYTFMPDPGQCAATASMTISVNQNITPTFTQVAAICNGDTLAALPTTSNNNITGSWSPALDNTNTTTYTFTPDVGQCAVSETMTITVNPTVTPVFTQVGEICSGESLAPLPTTSNNGVTGSWSPALDNTTTTTYTFTPDAGQCSVTETMTITVNPILIPVISSVDGNTLCVDFLTNEVQNAITLQSDLQNTNYTYTWYLNGVVIPGANQSTYTINTNAPGLYTLSIEEILPTANCTSDISEAFEVIQSGQAVLVSVTQSESFAPNPSINVTVDGYGEYWYQLDDGPILDNGGVFTNVSTGEHTIYVYDRKTGTPSCGFITIEDILVIDYPKMFTPNNDGYNDTWNVFAVSGLPNTKVTIFDRYGKVLTQLQSNSPGWDGTFKGEPLPTSDYWFVLNYEEDGDIKEFRSHFTLKR